MPELLEEPVTEVKEPLAESAEAAEITTSPSSEALDADPFIASQDPIVEVSDSPETSILADQATEVPAVEETVAVLEEPTAEAAELVEAECTLESQVLADQITEIPVSEEPVAVLEEPVSEAAELDEAESTSDAPALAEQVSDAQGEEAPVEEVHQVV